MKYLALLVLLNTITVHATELPVAARQLNRGVILQIEDITWQDADVKRNDSRIIDATKIVGLELKRTLNAGTPFRAQDVAEPTLVRRGQSITLLVSTGTMQLATSGKSLQDGAANALIRVQNNSTKRIIEGRVMDSNTVQVSAPLSFQTLSN
jgi:flagellar basal body P-ring formation protein FlgA